tara:strand:- start:120 stop:563 length:444 start_codon:yes stop_codon:yes gene_type:complete
MKINKSRLKQIIKEEISKLGEAMEKNILENFDDWNRTFEGNPQDPNFDFLDLYSKQLGQGYYGEYTTAISRLHSLQNYPQLQDKQSKYYLGQTLQILLDIKEKDLYQVWDKDLPPGVPSANGTSGFFSQVWLRVPRPKGYVNRWRNK